MGAYLSEPVTEKLSVDKSCERLCFGASSMQGWRVSQEDAHNCELDFDTNTSLFAVYDGHGGAEVAQYCAMNLPKFIKETETYKSGNVAQALEDAFLGIDAALIREDILAELKQMAGDGGQLSDAEENEIDNLHAEAHMPIEELLAKYRTNTSNSTKLLRKETRGSFLRPQPSDTAGPSGSFSIRQAPSKDSVPTDNGSGSDSARQEVVTNGLTDAEETSAKKSDDEAGEKSVSNGNPSSATTATTQPDAVSSTLKDKGLKGILGGGFKISKADVMATCSKILTPILQRKGIPRSARPASMEDASEESDETDDDDFNGPKTSEDDEDEEDEDEQADGKDESEESNESEEEEEDEDEEATADSEDFVSVDKEEPGFDSGCTAVVAILRNDDLYVANAGDSRCVVCRAGKAIEMSHDHKPEDEVERQRIEDAGGKVTIDGRVNGGLNLSRAIGDHSYKNNEKIPPRDQMISALPDIRTLTIEPDEDEFMVIACDGIWNFMNSQQVVDFIRERLTSDRKNISSICEELFDKCLSPTTMGDGTGCDNMTCIIVKFCQLPSKAASKRSSVSEEAPDSKRAKVDNGEAL